MDSRWLVCLPFIMTPGVMALAQQMPISNSCMESMKDDFAEDTVLLCPSPLPPVKTIHMEGSLGDENREREPDRNTFKPDIATVRRYFSKAREISEQDWMHKLTWV